MKIEKLEIKRDLNRVLEILHQDSLRYADGDFPGKGWVGDILESKRCFNFGLWDDVNSLVSVLLAERLIHKGCILWYIATDPDKRSLGYGGKLLEFFENFVKEEGLKWIFLNATEESLNFYKKHNYVTSKHSKVYEHVKDF